mgnify:CR=1 FL=1
MFMGSRRFKAYALNDSREFDDLQECIKYAADLVRGLMHKGVSKSNCHVSIFDNAYGTLIGFVFVRRQNWIRIDIDSNFLDS